jgi:CHAT domain-containing protein
MGDDTNEAGDVRNLKLKASLVVLSGCETARGRFENGEGSIGLSWAFLAAGARATVASQWRVESASTAQLMVAFHESWQKGASKAEALRLAALKVLAIERFHHPFYWAAFVLLGAGGRM